MNKRGQAGLPMNTLIIAIIAIIVLLLIVTFFTGGLGTIGEKIRDIFGKGTAGYDVGIARSFCSDYCSAAKRLPIEQQDDSAYCETTFDIKPAGGGEPARGKHCWDSAIGVDCSGVKDNTVNHC